MSIEQDDWAAHLPVAPPLEDNECMTAGEAAALNREQYRQAEAAAMRPKNTPKAENKPKVM